MNSSESSVSAMNHVVNNATFLDLRLFVRLLFNRQSSLLPTKASSPSNVYVASNQTHQSKSAFTNMPRPVPKECTR